MKRYLILLSALIVCCPLLAQQTTVREQIERLQMEHTVHFIYDAKVKLDVPYSGPSLTGKPLRQALKVLTENSNLEYQKTGKNIILQAAKKIQEKPRKITVYGVLTDNSGEPLISASVYDSKTMMGVHTDEHGRYSLPIFAGKHELTASYLGYEKRSWHMVFRKDTLVNIILQPSQNELEEIVIADKPDAGFSSVATGSHEIPLQQIMHTPVLLGEADVLKTVQLMPGVQSGTEGFSGMYVRGGESDQNLIMLDGLPIYNPQHMLGVVSIFTPEAIKKVTLYKGGYPAQYSGRASSVLDIRSNDGNLKEWSGNAGFSFGLMSGKVHFEGPIKKDKTSMSLTARANYLYYYGMYDINFKIQHIFDEKNRLYLGLYQGMDFLGWKTKDTTYDGGNDEWTNKQSGKFSWGNHLAYLRWNHVMSPKLFTNFTLSANHFGLKENNSNEEIISKQNHHYQFSHRYASGITDYSARMEFHYAASTTQDLRWGAEVLAHNYITEQEEFKENGKTLYADSICPKVTGEELSLYAQDELTFGRFSANIGANFSLFHTKKTTYTSLQPRISAKLTLAPEWDMKASYTEMGQYIHQLVSNTFTSPLDLWVPVTDKVKPIKARQVSLGIYTSKVKGWQISIEGYYKHLDNVLEFKDGKSGQSSLLNWEDNVEMGEGCSMGLELLVQKLKGRTTGWISYTLGKSDRIFENGTINSGKRFPYKYDRRHSFNICVNHKLTERIELAGTWTFYTGGRLTIPEEKTIVLLPDGSSIAAENVSTRNNYRLPCSHTLNVSLNLVRPLTGNRSHNWTFGIYNLYNSLNPNLAYADKKWPMSTVSESSGTYRSDDYRAHSVHTLTFLPIIPSVTYQYKF